MNIDGDGFLQLEAATICFAFTADGVRGTQGLFSRDASGYSGDGNHLSMYIKDGKLTVRLQNDNKDEYLSFGGIKAGQEYAVGLTFDGTTAQLIVDGSVVDTAQTGMTWATSPEDIQIGALGWRSKSGDDQITKLFDGEIRDVAIFDSVLTTDEMHALGETSAGAAEPEPAPEPEPTPEPTPAPEPEPEPEEPKKKTRRKPAARK